MSYTNSRTITYTKLSPNHSGTRTHTIDRITPHCTAGQCAVESLGSQFADPSRKASSNYGIDKNGRVGLYVEEKNRSWCSSDSANDNRAVTIECSSGSKHPYTMTSATYGALIQLCTDICKRNGKKKLLWFADKTKSLNYNPAADEMVITVHRWFANKACPGDWLYARLGDLAKQVTAALNDTKEENDMDIEKLISEITPEQAYRLSQKAQSYAGSLLEPEWSRNEGHWRRAKENGLLDGTRPEAYIKRDELATVLGRKNLI